MKQHRIIVAFVRISTILLCAFCFSVFPQAPEQESAQNLLNGFDARDIDGVSGLTIAEAEIEAVIFEALDRNGNEVLERLELVQASLAGDYHSTDRGQDGHLGLSDLLRAIQFYNAGAFSCAVSVTEDGYQPFTGNTDCLRYAADLNTDWQVSLSELLRVIQLYNWRQYHYCPDKRSEDGFCKGEAPPPPVTATGEYVVLAYNDLGMHCMNQDFSKLMVLPPYNTLHAQVIRRGAEEPDIITEDVTVRYRIIGNTTSTDKTNFWDYDAALLGVDLAPDVGLTGNGLSGTMTPTGNSDWNVTGIPVTPVNDLGQEDPYPWAEVVVNHNGTDVAVTRAVTPVSWEMRCDLCHVAEDAGTDVDILRDHDRLHGTNLENSTPVFCGSCHGQAPLGTVGTPALSHAMHTAHAPRMGAAPLDVACYACHPGVQTQCQRDIHSARGISCTDCHGGMLDVGDTGRRPWLDEPRCGSCHTRAGFQFEQAGLLYRESKGHEGIHCAACHGSPHAITPTLTPEDNVQAFMAQGEAGVIGTCSVCHAQQPTEAFEHRWENDKG